MKNNLKILSFLVLMFVACLGIAFAASHMVEIFSDPHFGIKDSVAPSLSSCGTGPSRVGNDNIGTITPGSGAISCSLNFNDAFTNVPPCVVSGMGTYDVHLTSATVDHFTVDWSTPPSKINYNCTGYR